MRLNESAYETLSRLLYSPDLCPNDHHFFKHLNNIIRDKRLKPEDDCKNAFNASVVSREKDFYSSSMNKQISR